MVQVSVSSISVPPRFYRRSEPSCYDLFVDCSYSIHNPCFCCLPGRSACPIPQQKLALYCRIVLPDTQNSPWFTPSRDIALCSWLVANTLDPCNYRQDGTFMVTNPGPPILLFSSTSTITYLLCHLGRFHFSWFYFWGANPRVWVSLLYLFIICFLRCLRDNFLRCWAGGICPMDSGCLILSTKS